MKLNPHRDVGVFIYNEYLFYMNIRRIIKEEVKLYVEGIEHMQKLYKAWANKKSGNPDKAMKIMDDVIKYRKSLPKKDFAKYNSYEELKTDLDTIINKAKSKDVTKFYEDGELLVMAANTWQASCKYGSSTKWCTTAKDTSSYWNRHRETGTEFFWIFKKVDPSNSKHKYSVHIKDRKSTPTGRDIEYGEYMLDVCDAVNNCGGPGYRVFEDSLIVKHPKFKEILSKLMEYHKGSVSKRKEEKAKKERERRERMGVAERWLYDNEEVITDWIERNNDNVVDGIMESEGMSFGNYIDEYLMDTGYDILYDAVGEALYDYEYEEIGYTEIMDLLSKDIGIDLDNFYRGRSVVDDGDIERYKDFFDIDDDMIDAHIIYRDFGYALREVIEGLIVRGRLSTEPSEWMEALTGVQYSEDGTYRRNNLRDILVEELFELAQESIREVGDNIFSGIFDWFRDNEEELEELENELLD